MLSCNADVCVNGQCVLEGDVEQCVCADGFTGEYHHWHSHFAFIMMLIDRC